jgi:hypothetical protein
MLACLLLKKTRQKYLGTPPEMAVAWVLLLLLRQHHMSMSSDM